MGKGSFKADTVLGSAILHLKTLAWESPGTQQTLSWSPFQLSLSDVETGDPTGTSVMIAVRLVQKSVGFGFGLENVYEFERWRLECEPKWGNSSKYLLPTDPGRWSDSKERYAWTLDEASTPLPPGWHADS